MVAAVHKPIDAVAEHYRSRGEQRQHLEYGSRKYCEVTILQLGGTVAAYNLPATMTVGTFKRHLWDETRIPVSRQQLMIGDVQLKDGESLASRLADGAVLTVTLVVRTTRRSASHDDRNAEFYGALGGMVKRYIAQRYQHCSESSTPPSVPSSSPERELSDASTSS